MFRKVLKKGKQAWKWPVSCIWKMFSLAKTLDNPKRRAYNNPRDIPEVCASISFLPTLLKWSSRSFGAVRPPSQDVRGRQKLAIEYQPAYIAGEKT